MKHKHLIAVIASGLTVVASCPKNTAANEPKRRGEQDETPR